jgi:hypothetical protein
VICALKSLPPKAIEGCIIIGLIETICFFNSIVVTTMKVC